MSERPRHSLLKRQLRRQFGSSGQAPPTLATFLQAIDEAYRAFDVDRELLERSLELSSRELLQANAQLRAMLQAFPDTFLKLDADDRITNAHLGTVRPCNEVSALIGKPLVDLPCIGPVLLEITATVRRTGRPANTVRGGGIGVGREGWMEVRVTPLVEDELLLILRDITRERRQQEAEQRASKLDSLGMLAGGIAHDFNNTLTAVLGNISLARLQAGSAQLEDLLGESERALRRATALTRQLLTFAKGDAPHKVRGSVKALVSDAVKFALRGSNLSCRLDLADDLEAVLMDEGQMSRVFHNLVINADQAMPDGGQLQIRAANVEIDADSAHGSLPPGRYVRVDVTDEGCGIHSEHLDKVFDPYFTTKPDGTGLGLAACYSIVEKHGGSIRVESSSDDGSTFSVVLPAAGQMRAAKPTHDDGQLARGGRILIMDDQAIVRATLSRMLRYLGFSVDAVEDGERALERFIDSRAAGRGFDAVILDLTIPGGLGGSMTVQQLRQLDSRVPVIASSGYSEDPVMAHYDDYGFTAVLRKPYDAEQLRSLLNEVLAGAESASQYATSRK